MKLKKINFYQTTNMKISELIKYNKSKKKEKENDC